MTDFTDRLAFVEQVEKSDGYSTVSKQVKVSYKKLFNKFDYDKSQNTEEGSLFVTTRVKKGLLSSNLHIMSLDCDSESNKNKAQSYLNNYSIDHYLIESTRGHYWIICNFVDSIHQVIEQMKLIPGVDTEYVKIAEKRKILNLRAYPRGGTIPRFTQAIPEGEGLNDLYVQWIKDFAHYWMSDEMKETYYSYLYHWSMKNSEAIRLLVREQNREMVEGKIEACRAIFGELPIPEATRGVDASPINDLEISDPF